VVAAFPRVLLLSSDRLQDIYLGNSGHGFCSSLLEELGFQLVAPANWKPDPQTPLIPISLETLPELDRADRVILLGHGFSGWQGNANFERQQLADLKQAWSKNAIAQSLKTSKNGRISFIPAYLCLGLPGPIGTELYLNELKKQLSIH
jgi:iron complex transport system substrate-binding protein